MHLKSLNIDLHLHDLQGEFNLIYTSNRNDSAPIFLARHITRKFILFFPYDLSFERRTESDLESLIELFRSIESKVHYAATNSSHLCKNIKLYEA